MDPRRYKFFHSDCRVLGSNGAKCGAPYFAPNPKSNKIPSNSVSLQFHPRKTRTLPLELLWILLTFFSYLLSINQAEREEIIRNTSFIQINLRSGMETGPLWSKSEREFDRTTPSPRRYNLDQALP